MRSGCVLLALACACYRGAPTVSQQQPPVPVKREPPALVEPFTITAAELGADDVVERIPHRTRLGRFGNAYLRLGNQPIQTFVGGQDTWQFDRNYPVIDQTETHIRIVLEDASVRYALWVQAIDTRETVLARVRLLPNARARYETTQVGAWLDPGAPVNVGREARRRQVKLRDKRVEVVGFVDEALVGRVWVERTHRKKSLGADGLAEPYVERPPEDLTVILPAGTKIHLAPDVTSTVVATARKHVAARRLGRAGRWTEVEVTRPYAVLRGHAQILEELDRVGRVVVTDTSSVITNPGTRFPIQLAAGSCLYDAVDGEPIGAQLETARRLASQTTKPDWLELYHQTPWGDVSVYVHSSSADPSQPVWLPCSRR